MTLAVDWGHKKKINLEIQKDEYFTMAVVFILLKYTHIFKLYYSNFDKHQTLITGHIGNLTPEILLQIDSSTITLQTFHPFFSRCLRDLLADMQKRWKPPENEVATVAYPIQFCLWQFIPSYWFIQLQNCFHNRNVDTFVSKLHF